MGTEMYHLQDFHRFKDYFAFKVQRLIFPNMDKEWGENEKPRPSDEGKEWAKRIKKRIRRMGGGVSSLGNDS